MLHQNLHPKTTPQNGTLSTVVEPLSICHPTPTPQPSTPPSFRALALATFRSRSSVTSFASTFAASSVLRHTSVDTALCFDDAESCVVAAYVPDPASARTTPDRLANRTSDEQSPI